MENLRKIYEEIAFFSEKLIHFCKKNGIKIATAESCTGGMISAALTSVPGSSAVIELGVCSYSNRIKHEVLGVSAETLEKFSEYSVQCAEEMALGAARVSGADYAVSTTGVAGPTGPARSASGADEHPVGEVFIGVVNNGSARAERFQFNGSREEVRAEACRKALELLIKLIETE